MFAEDVYKCDRHFSRSMFGPTGRRLTRCAIPDISGTYNEEVRKSVSILKYVILMLSFFLFYPYIHFSF